MNLRSTMRVRSCKSPTKFSESSLIYNSLNRKEETKRRLLFLGVLTGGLTDTKGRGPIEKPMGSKVDGSRGPTRECINTRRKKQKSDKSVPKYLYRRCIKLYLFR